MLVRGALRRVADIPRAPTHDLAHVTRVLLRTSAARNVASVPAARDLAKVHLALLQTRRTYATASTQATKPTAKVKRDVKKAAAKKPAAKTVRKSTAKKPVKKTVAKKKTTKAKAKKTTAAKPKRVKKVLTQEEKDKAKIKELKMLALRSPSTTRAMTAWQVYMAENSKRGPGDDKGIEIGSISATLATNFKKLTPAELEHLNHLAIERTTEKRAVYNAWIQSHTPDMIRRANIARAALRRKLGAKEGLGHQTKQLMKPLEDDRLAKRPNTPFTLFNKERSPSGDFKGIALGDTIRLIAQEWKALSPSERKPYDDEAAEQRQAYYREYQQVYGHAAAGPLAAGKTKVAAAA